MDFQKLQRKVIRRLTSPGELVHTALSHWFLIVCLAFAGGLGIFAKITGDPPFFRAEAKIKLTPNYPTFDERFRSNALSSEKVDFVREQLSILTSDVVYRYAVQSLPSYDEILHQGEDTRAESELGLLQKWYRAGKEWIEYVIGSLHPALEGSAEERQLLMAIGSFRNRSYPEVVKSSTIVKLVAFGSRRDLLLDELRAWIKAYKRRIAEFTKEKFDIYGRDKLKKWEEAVTATKAEIDRHKTANPQATETKLSTLVRQQNRRELFIERLRERRALLTDERDDKSGELLPRLQPLEKVEPTRDELQLESLENKLSSLRLERADLQGIHPEGSTRLRQHDDKIASVQRQIEETKKRIAERRRAAPPAPGAQDGAPQGSDAAPGETLADKRAILDEAIRQENEELEGMDVERQAISSVLKELQRLEEAHKLALDNKRQVENLLIITGEGMVGQNIVQVEDVDFPVASLTPVNSSKHLYVALGAACGVGLGLVLAFLIELFHKTITFKADVSQDLDLEVVGVLPE